MSSRIFEGNVSIVKNTKGEVALKRAADGAFNAENAEACYKQMLEFSKKLKAPINKWSLFIAEGGKDVILMADRYGNPRITLLPPREGGTVTKAKVVKLA